MLKKEERNLLLFLMGFVLQSYLVSGEHPWQTLLSTLECYGTHQPGCDTDFIEVYPELSRSYDNFSEARTRFYLFTPKNPDDPELMHKCGGGLPPNSNFNRECKTLIVFPGFVSGVCHMAIYKEMIYQRMKCGCYNYIHVEWTWGNSFDLIGATKNMKIVAKQIAVVIRGLKEKFGLTPRNFICAGHSLGAHGCGFVGQEEKIYAIHGLDPAGVVYWEDMPLDERLDPGDADCVQATHCSYGQCLPNYFGVNFTLGTKDFFFNDGEHQPSCIKQMFLSFLKGDTLYALASLIPAACNHLQCLQYYKNSFCSPDCKWAAVACNDTESFLKGKCNDCGPEGENCDLTGIDSCECRGPGDKRKFYRKGGFVCPFCNNHGLKNVDKLQCQNV